jgi:hypothetical protein
MNSTTTPQIPPPGEQLSRLAVASRAAQVADQAALLTRTADAAKAHLNLGQRTQEALARQTLGHHLPPPPPKPAGDEDMQTISVDSPVTTTTNHYYPPAAQPPPAAPAAIATPGNTTGLGPVGRAAAVAALLVSTGAAGTVAGWLARGPAAPPAALPAATAPTAAPQAAAPVPLPPRPAATLPPGYRLELVTPTPPTKTT